MTEESSETDLALQKHQIGKILQRYHYTEMGFLNDFVCIVPQLFMAINEVLSEKAMQDLLLASSTELKTLIVILGDMLDSIENQELHHDK